MENSRNEQLRSFKFHAVILRSMMKSHVVLPHPSQDHPSSMSSAPASQPSPCPGWMTEDHLGQMILLLRYSQRVSGRLTLHNSASVVHVASSNHIGILSLDIVSGRKK